jgi:hypothetical protein
MRHRRPCLAQRLIKSRRRDHAPDAHQRAVGHTARSPARNALEPHDQSRASETRALKRDAVRSHSGHTLRPELLVCDRPRSYRFFPPTPGTAVTCFIHAAIWGSSRSLSDLSSTPRVDLPIATGVTGGTGVSVRPLMNMSLT